MPIKLAPLNGLAEGGGERWQKEKEKVIFYWGVAADCCCIDVFFFLLGGSGKGLGINLPMSEIDGQNGKKEEVLDGLVLLLGIFRSFGTRCISTPSFVVNLAPSSPLPSRASASSFKALCAIIVCANQHILSNIYRLEWQGGGGRDRDKLLLRESNGIWQRKKKPSNITKFPTWFPNDRVRRPQKSFVEYFLFCKKNLFL